MLNRLTMRIVAIAAVLAITAAAGPRNSTNLLVELDRALAKGQVERMREVVTEILGRPHLELDLLLQAGLKLAQRDLYPEAAQIFARCQKDYPSSFEARYDLALADFALRKFDEARAALDGLENLSKTEQFARDYLRGKIYDATGDQVQAERNLSAAFSGAPAEENYALDLGLFYLRRESYARAVSTLEIGVKHHPDSVFLGLGLGVAQLFGDHPSSSVATCRRVLKIEPAFAPARLLLTIAYYMNGENENCVREAEAALRQPDAMSYLYYLHAAALVKLDSKDYDLLLRDLDAAIRNIPGCSFCYFTASKVHQTKGDEAAAITDLETLVSRIDPEFSQGWYRLSTLYQHTGRDADAANALARFRAIKAAQTDRETEYLRKLFLSALSGK